MTTAMNYAHIDIRADGLAWITNTQIKVLEVAIDHAFRGWEADEIHRQHEHLTLAQIHAALTYYYDHKAEVDRVIEERRQLAHEMQTRQGESPIKANLRARGLIP